MRQRLQSINDGSWAGDNGSRAGIDGPCAGDDKSQVGDDGLRTSAYVNARMHLYAQFIRAKRLVLDTWPYNFSFFCFRTCLAERLCLRATTFARNYVFARPPEPATTFINNDM